MIITTIKKNAEVEWWIVFSKILHQVMKNSYWINLCKNSCTNSDFLGVFFPQTKLLKLPWNPKVSRQS